jgi:hypothetical protein
MPDNTLFDLEDALSQSSIVPDAVFEQRLGARLDSLRQSLPTEAPIATNGRQRDINRRINTSLPQEHRRTVKNSSLVPAFASIFAVCLLVGMGVAILLPSLNTVTPVATETATSEALTASPTQPTSIPTQTITGTAQATSTGTLPPVIPTSTTVIQDGNTSVPTQIPPTVIPTTSATGPEIFDFQVSPADFTTGDEVLVTWRASGTAARVCYNSNLWYPPHCWTEPVVGSRTFTVNDQEGKIEISLMVWTEVPDMQPYPQTMKSAAVDLGCLRKWVLPVPPEWADHCPAAAQTTSGAAAQPFEHGWMIYENERYLILLNAPFEYGTEAGSMQFQTHHHLLTITQDTSADYTPPPGLYAPISGFGLIWRGDTDSSPGYHEELGWATQPEFNFNPITQCAVIGTRGNSRCFMTHPQRGLIGLVVNGFSFSYWLDYP